MVVIILSLLFLLSFTILLLHKLSYSTFLEELKDLEDQLYILERRSNGLKVRRKVSDYALSLVLSTDLSPMSNLTVSFFGSINYLL